ncbi:5-dehydro-2-deoxygluconokinase [Pelagibius sp. Alg239-R121]|uniref:bifunctional 5-dehydro-2-deoxygluconokinase/5-dehydro-2- deoxyphosphogluconate aldolase n=1 Tax=Pelagibius sp. Alg239-R121 TaxID=2993448 RepID=UPI0024A76AF5|nr:5-dehydro-2-deoxygluconokinase [Pelagibius sp. Alg239-R121]
MTERRFDVIGMGRAGVDLYGEQVGGRLEDMASFAKYVGGSPCNTCIGAARLGLRPAMLARVGDEHMGRFIRETLEAEGVDTGHLKTDKDRLTALVILGIQDRETFPLIFYRENCADMAIDPADFDPAFIAESKCLLVSGTHFSTPQVNNASRTAMRYARAAGTKVALDIDYRPVLWGLTGRGLGEERFVASEAVSAHLQSIVPDCDLIVGTEEEIHIAGGDTDTLTALRRLREITTAVLVVKRGPMGCVVFPDAIPEDIEQGIKGPGFPIEVFNVLGAGDAFMAGFLRGWLREEPYETCSAYANACGAFAVSRHGCSPACPSWDELSDFLKVGSPHFRLRNDARLEQLHWASNRTKEWPEVCAFAFDHRMQLEAIAQRHQKTEEDIHRFKCLAWRAAQEAASSVEGGRGILCDGRLGQDALDAATGKGVWIGRPIELPGSRPLQFEGGDNVAATLREWPAEHCVKCLVFYHPDDPADLRQQQEDKVKSLFEACRVTRHELLLEVIPPKESKVDASTVARSMQRFYDLGIYPDWWKLQAPDTDEGWHNITDGITRNDPYCRGVLLLGLEAPEEVLGAAFAAAASQPLCKGFAVGRSIFGAPAEGWFAGELSDNDAVAAMSGSYARLMELWRSKRSDI